MSEKRRVYELALTTLLGGREYGGRMTPRNINVIVVAETIDRALELARSHYADEQGGPNIWNITHRGARELLVDTPAEEESHDH